MLFSSITFLYYFLPAVLVIYYLAPAKVKNLILFLASFVFYLWGEPKYSVLLLFSVTAGYMGGRCIEYQRQKKCVSAADPADRSGKYKGGHDRLVVGIFTAMTLGLLVFFKYMDFLADSVNRILGTHVPMVQIALPVGISFYTFQIISYYVDVYRGEVAAEHNFVDFAAYVTMFPQLIAGPIVRFQSVQAELKHREITWEKNGEGAARFVCGLCKKVLIADSLASLISALQNISETAAKAVVNTGIRAEGAGIGTLGYWVLALAFMLQLYYDFSGYSDMAIGLGKILGFTFPENFRYPFISKSISEFWRRWHMTLGGWFRDYLYIPLGGNRVSVLRWCFNMFVVWLLSGLWHGAGWNFALWGLYFGAFLSAEKLIGRKWKERSFKIADISANNDSNGGNRENMFLTCVRNIIEHGYVLLVVLFSFVIFRVEGDRVNIEFDMPSRGIIGLRTNVLTASAGEAIMAHRFKCYQPYKGEIERRSNGSMIAMESGTAFAYAIDKLQDRGKFFIYPQDEVYAGQVVGEHVHENDLVINVTKSKKLTNMRASGSDDKARIIPPVVFSLEEALEYIKEDEYVEVTPKAMRMRKVILDEIERKRANKN